MGRGSATHTHTHMHIHIHVQIHAQFQSLYKSSQKPYSFLHRVEIDMFLCDSDLSKETKEEKKAEEERTSVFV
jgi:hypothetical protein